MTDVMRGVRILEVAEHTFVPAASALLADYGAEVIKIEHVERGDAMRGLASSGLAVFGGKVHVLLEHSNRGKQSLGLDLTKQEGLDILYQLAATCDVFLTNKLPSVRKKLKIELEDIRAHNPNIIYVSGTGQGENGPDADAGSYDQLAYWSRAGVAMGVTPPDAQAPVPPPGPAFGDSIGAMTIAGGIMGALFHRERTGEATTVDVSLLATGLWSMGATMALSMQLGMGWRGQPAGAPSGNPLVRTYRTSDDKFIALSCLQPARYWAEACKILDRPDLIDDPRFADAASIVQNTAEGSAIFEEEFLKRTADEWRKRFAGFSGQWTYVQDTLEAAADPQVEANGMIGELTTKEGEPFKLVAGPVQFGGSAAQPKRAPEFNEHGDAILEGLGLDWEKIVELKVQGVVA
jgi:crotonobetainyl-CoA:carnitine CoA-transferase CaiB-like acyl-CoA transferase